LSTEQLLSTTVVQIINTAMTARRELANGGLSVTQNNATSLMWM